MSVRKKIYIPTDFSIKSLNIIKELVDDYTNAVYDIVLISGYQVSNSVFDLLFFSNKRVENKLQITEFIRACEVIKNAHQSIISSIRLDFIPFRTKVYINSYFHKHNIDVFVISKNEKLNFSNQNSFDLTPYILNSKIPVKEVLLSRNKINEFYHAELIEGLFI